MKTAIYPEKPTDKIYTVTRVEPKSKPAYTAIKRACDVVLSFIAGIIMLIPMMIIAICIKADSKGSAIFKQERLGKEGKPFIMYKFRSMIDDAEADGPQWAAKNDHRITRVGHVLRCTRLDELPQLWNIFKGDMSIVGPRPERACFYEEFETYIHGFSNRMAVKPGLTGLAQVNGRDFLNPEKKVKFDREYLTHLSFKMDLYIFFKSIIVVFSHADFFEGKIEK